ncbi:hypothetical protein B566_EDAN011539 [Ephemera danica]|nr:hypothetical protein B566_EDAN011539 [Ephemera danica]
MDDDYDMYEDYEEMYANPNPYIAGGDLWQEENEQLGMTALDIWNLCVIPSVNDGILHSVHLLLGFQLPPLACHAVSAASGLLVLHHFFQTMTYFILAFATFMYFILFAVFRYLKKWKGAVTSLICITTLIVSELALVHNSLWHKIRGAQMLLAMKAISVGFDIEIGTLKCLPTLPEFAGYVFSVGTCVFGPWNIDWIYRVLLSLLFSLGFLTISTCGIHYLIPDHSWRWWLAFRDALSFRSSHYFVSFLSEAAAIMTGFGSQDNDWNLPVSRPQYIEIPRSLVQVVVYWNIPTHYFLKHYIFRTTKPLGSFASIIATYAVSSLLHGLNFQLAAVLLSLGFYTYVEYVMRHKLAAVFSACVLVRPCKKDCHHNNKEKRVWVVLANLLFGLIAFFHLTYLGVMFDSDDSLLQEDGYNYGHSIRKWSSLRFASHWLALFTYIFHLLI